MTMAIPPHPEATPRSHRWVLASFRAARFGNPRAGASMVATIQALGALDEALIVIDSRYVSGEGYIDSDRGIMSFNVHLTQSYLWVLGMYEIVRILRANSQGEVATRDERLEGLYRSFTRLRIPLAKFEPAGKYRDTDGHVAFPALNSNYGVAWQVAEDTFIARGELSEGLLGYLESLPPVQD